MKCEIRAPELEVGDDVGRHVRRQLGLALACYEDRLGAVIVRLAARVGRRARREIRCRVSAELAPLRGTVMVESTDPDLFAAVSHAATKIGEAIGRRLGGGRPRPGREARWLS